jgi:hypothetical protein
MTPSQHFLLSFATSIFTGIALAVGVMFCQDWISERGIYPPIAMLVAFLIGNMGMRWYFRTFVRVNCLFGCGKKAYALKGRSDRFRCEQCGNDM